MNDSPKPLRLGMVGLDTSHVIGFAKILNRPEDEFHIPGATITHGFPGGSDDFEMSYSRIEGFTKELSNEFGVEIVDSIEAVAEACDAIIMTSVDGRQHLEQFEILSQYKKPVFIDKPFAVASADATRIAALSRQTGTPVMSASSKRFAEQLPQAIEKLGKANILGAEFFGAMPIEETQGRYCWYGIHTADALYSVMGVGCESVTVEASERYDLIVGKWKDGRIGTLRGSRTEGRFFGGILFLEEETALVDLDKVAKPLYYYLVDLYLEFFRTGKSAIDLDETVEIIRFLEAAEESFHSGKSVAL